MIALCTCGLVSDRTKYSATIQRTPGGANKCYLIENKDYLLAIDNTDVHISKARLIKSTVWHRQLESTAEQFGEEQNIFQARFLTNRQRRLVTYHKMYNLIFGTRNDDRSRRVLPECLRLFLLQHFPDDDDDAQCLKELEAGDDDLSF